MTDTCETCKFWRSERYNIGACCIRAPKVIPDPRGKPETWFPETRSGQGCGEHQPKDIDTTAEVKLLTPENVAHASTLVAIGQWKNVEEESNENKPTTTN